MRVWLKEAATLDGVASVKSIHVAGMAVVAAPSIQGGGVPLRHTGPALYRA